MAAYHFALRRAACLLLLTAALCAVSAVNASAQLVRAGSPRLVDSGDLMIGGDVAYDPAHHVYLVVLARESSDDISGSVWGAFLDTAGNAEPAFLIHSGGRANFARVAYSPDVSDGAGGHGGFLVTWTEPFTPGVFSTIVAYPNSIDGAPHLLSAEYNLREMAYSPASQRFMLAWESYDTPQSAYFQQVALSAAPVGGPVALTSGNAGRPWIIWNSITSIDWHAGRNEFGILYAAQVGSSWIMRFARVTPGGALVDTRDVAQLGAEPIAAALRFSPLTGNYVALWAEPIAGAITGAELSGTGDVIARGPIPQSIVAGQNGMALAYSEGSGTFLLLGYATLGTVVDQIQGIELNKHGAPSSSVIPVTDFPLTTNYFAPRAAGRSDAPEWLVTAGTFSPFAQIVSTSTLHGGSELRLDGCVGPDPFAALGGGHCVGGGWVPPASAPPAPSQPSGQPAGCATPDPFAAMGGGTCYNGGWLPPGMPIPNAPAPGPEPPAPPPPPPPPAGCTTPDPFVAMGGGTCYNGGWLPPGMPVPNAPAPGPEPTPTPPPPPPPAGCTTSDPFVAMGGGTCYNGGWLPPGMPVPNAPAPGPTPTPPPPPPPPSSGCTTADPFVAMGGGTCYNGGWLPPGMPVPNQPAPGPGPAPTTPPPPPLSAGCTTPDPFAALGGGQCVNGGWLPPGMYFPGNGIIGPNPDPLFPPPPQSTNNCTTPDPFLDMPGLIGVCVNGVWQPVNGAHATGTVFRIDGVWMLREDDTGLVYTPLNGMPSSLHTLGLPVYFEGVLRYDILHTFAAPILQVRTLVLR